MPSAAWTTVGIALDQQLVKGDTNHHPTSIGLGEGTTAADKSDTDLEDERTLSRPAATVSVTGDKLTWSLHFLMDFNADVSEYGVFYGDRGATDSVLYIRVVGDPVPLKDGDYIDFTISLRKT